MEVNESHESDTQECRICFEEDDPSNMIYPCKCNGTIKWVHKTCLDQWVDINPSVNGKCLQCNYTYKITSTDETPIISFLYKHSAMTSLFISMLILVEYAILTYKFLGYIPSIKLTFGILWVLAWVLGLVELYTPIFDLVDINKVIKNHLNKLLQNNIRKFRYYFNYHSPPTPHTPPT